MSDPAAQDDRYRPTSLRQRLIIVAVTVATVVTLWLLLLYRPGGHPRTYPRPAPEACSVGQQTGCIGGRADVSLIATEPAVPHPAGASASAP